MLKTGDSSSKHGGAQAATVRTHQLLSDTSTKCTPSLQIVGRLPNADNSQTTSVVLQCHGAGSGRYTFANNGGVVVGLSRAASTSSPTPSTGHHFSNTSTAYSASGINDEHAGDDEETKALRNQALEWLQVKVEEAKDLGLLQVEEAKVPLSSLPLLDTSGAFSERVNDFAFASSISQNSVMKQNVDVNYFETLDNGDYTTTGNTPHISWNSSNPGEQHTSLPVPSEVFVSFPDALAEDVNSAGEALSCSTSDLNSMLFEGMKSDSLPVEIMHYTDSLNYTVVGGKNVLCSDDSVNNFNTISSSSSNLKSIPSTFAGTMVDQVALPNLHDSSSDLNLTSLPNFLGLENTSVSASGHFIDGNSVNVLEENTLSLENQIVANSANLSEHILQSIDSSQLKNQNITVTTISISNDEENSTKILVDSHQGQQQMYVINTANMNKSRNRNIHQGNMFVINASDLNPACDGTFSISALNSNVENMAMTSQPITSQPSLTNSTIPGFVLVPVVESAANMVQAVPIHITNGDPDTKKPKKMFMCVAPGCRKTFKKASKLKVHQMLHTGERPFKCSLLGCEWAFTTSNKLKRHMESHEGRKDYMCDKPGCGHRFTTVYNLNNHRKLHDRPCTETCTEDGCSQKFATKRQLDLHLRNVHACEDRTFKCPEPGCEKTFFSSGCMGSHMKVHLQNQEELRCKVPGCGKEFTKMCRLRQHERLHSGEKPFTCDYQGCTWAFATASKLKRHQTKHTGLRKWICEVCKKQFHRSEHLKGHLITHSGDRPFICPVEGCGNTFTAKSSLYVHLKKHDESGKTIVYHCPMENCDKHYANKASLRQHILVKHFNMAHKGDAAEGSHGVVSWLGLLSSGDANADISLGQEESYAEGLCQTSMTPGQDPMTPGQDPMTPGQDPMMPTDFLTGDQTLLNSSSETLPDHQSCSGLMSQLMVSTGPGVTLASPDVAPPLAVAATDISSHPLQQPQQQQHMFIDDSVDQRLLEASEILQQQERLSFEAVERGKKSQIVLENMLGSARTDPRSNDIISLRSLKRWQKQKEIEAAKLRVRLNAPTASSTSCQLVLDAEGDYKDIVSNNVSLAGHHLIQTVIVPGRHDTEIPVMELQAEGISDSSSGSTADSFMTDLFIRDPETGMTYRQTQLLQDDPPNPEMMEDMEGVTSCHGMTLDTSLDTQFVEDSLNFHSL
ncbi:unnamed protein product [Candidula unifasciata]|uniref:C2H2-type domain-containing protein n=1 Tax=Candidula unifasciata TaxID=100452 RepID=A0A8S3YSF5_9EUPU|nr:unnamed protein product [Candidula unifasciata]